MSRRVSLVGLGKLGSSMAAAMASRGHEVIGVDVNQAAVDAINAGRAPVEEPGLQDLVTRHAARLRATTRHAEAVRASAITFVVVPTPSDARGAFSLEHAAEACRAIGAALAGRRDWHTVVLTSTVLPGATRHGLVPILERHSGRTAGVDFGVCYSPAFVALGSVTRDFLNPDFALIGELDPRSGDDLAACYAGVIAASAPRRRMTLENAELTKISVNAFVTMKITFANMLAELCAALPGGDVDVVADAIGSDTRIGRKYLTGGLGFGGPCFPRDNAGLAFTAAALGVRPDLLVATDRLNRSLPERIVAEWRTRLGGGATVAVLGLAYKPSTAVIDASHPLLIARALLDAGVRVQAYDPLAGEAARVALDGRAVIKDSARDCVRDADAVLIGTPDPEFTTLGPGDFRQGGRPVLVVDFWRILAQRLAGAAGIEYVAYGRAPATLPAEALRALWSDTPAGDGR